jgi:hypothetical protein
MTIQDITAGTPAEPDDNDDIFLTRPDLTGPDDDSVTVLRRDLIDLIRYVDATRDWCAELEEMHGAPANRVAMHQAAFTIRALPPNDALEERAPVFTA